MTVNNKTVQSFFSENLTKSFIDEIYSKISSPEFPDSQVNVDFHIKEGKMSCSKPWNTQFCMDTDDMESANSIIDFLGSCEDPSSSDIKEFETWREACSKKLQDVIDNSFRKNCLRIVFDTDDILSFPLNTIRVYDIDITQRPENDKVLVVRKDAPNGINTPPVTAEIIEAYENEGVDLNDFIIKKKESGDLKYKYVTSAEWRKHFYDITISMMIDYSPARPPN
jgi:hypothetical protein